MAGDRREDRAGPRYRDLVRLIQCTSPVERGVIRVTYAAVCSCGWRFDPTEEDSLADVMHSISSHVVGTVHDA